MQTTLRILAALAFAALLSGCFPQGRHQYTSSGPTDAASQEFWTDKSNRQEQARQWREQTERERAARMDGYLRRD